MRLPLSDPDLTIGPIISREPRIAVVAKDHPLAAHKSISVEDLVGYTLPYAPVLPREMFDAFVPPRTPSGRPLRRIEYASTAADSVIRAAMGDVVHPTVRSLLEHYRSDEVVGVPIRDMPPSETALVWLRARTNSKIEEFARAAADVMAAHADEHPDGLTAPPTRDALLAVTSDAVTTDAAQPTPSRRTPLSEAWTLRL